VRLILCLTRQITPLARCAKSRNRALLSVRRCSCPARSHSLFEPALRFPYKAIIFCTAEHNKFITFRSGTGCNRLAPEFGAGCQNCSTTTPSLRTFLHCVFSRAALDLTIPEAAHPEILSSSCRGRSFAAMFTLFLFLFLASTVWSTNFSTAGCVDAAGTEACLQKTTTDLTAACETACETTFNSDCAIACVCEGYKKNINCALSSCWNKVHRRPVI
jgi:hypothetical protein